LTVSPVVSGLLIGVAVQQPGKPYRVALIGYQPGAKMVRVRSKADVAKLAAKHRASGVVWEGDDDTFRSWKAESADQEAASGRRAARPRRPVDTVPL
jgi:hypothetical protein